MIAIDYPTFSMALRVAQGSAHPEAAEMLKRMQDAALDLIAGDAKFNNEVPALCRRQAG